MGSRRVGLGLGGYWTVGAAYGAVLCPAIVDVGVLNLFGSHSSGELMLRCDDGWNCQRIWRHKTKQPRVHSL